MAILVAIILVVLLEAISGRLVAISGYEWLLVSMLVAIRGYSSLSVAMLVAISGLLVAISCY